MPALAQRRRKDFLQHDGVAQILRGAEEDCKAFLQGRLRPLMHPEVLVGVLALGVLLFLGRALIAGEILDGATITVDAGQEGLSLGYTNPAGVGDADKL